MSKDTPLHLTKYAQINYGITGTVELELARNFTRMIMIMTMAGADGEVAESELQWYIDEQRLLFANPQELIEYARSIDLNKIDVDINKALDEHISLDKTLDFPSMLLYQAIKMSRADGEYHVKEKEAIHQVAQKIGIKSETVKALESLAELEDVANGLRLSLVGPKV